MTPLVKLRRPLAANADAAPEDVLAAKTALDWMTDGPGKVGRIFRRTEDLGSPTQRTGLDGTVARAISRVRKNEAVKKLERKLLECRKGGK